MPIYRRSLLALVGSAFAAPAAWADSSTPATPGAPPSSAPGTDPNSPFALRSLGSPKAPVTAIEYFSLTCTHCAHFATVTMPQVKPNLIDTGKLQLIYRDFPLDGVALMAAQVARSLPADEYYPFIEALFSNQGDWAFVPVNDTNHPPDYASLIYKYAALAGMDQATFNAAINNKDLKNFIVQEEQDAETRYKVDSTPSFIINGQLFPGAMEYDEFAATVNKLAGA